MRVLYQGNHLLQILLKVLLWLHLLYYFIYGLATYHWLQLHNNGMNNFLTNIQGQAIRMYTVTLK